MKNDSNRRARGLSVPVLQTLRGAGLGNEIIPWGKAFIAGEELGLRVIRPAWGMNRRGYRHDFDTGRSDWFLQQALRTWPAVTIDSDECRDDDDYAGVVKRKFAALPPMGERPLVLRNASGMAGGFLGICKARDYLRTQLLQPKHVTSDLYWLSRMVEENKLLVSIHVRRGDFASGDGDPKPGEFNKAISVDWYRNVAREMVRHFKGRIQFLVFSDSEDPDVTSLSTELRAVQLPLRIRPLLSDILMMSHSDLLVCSVSALSMLSAFLSDRPYVWYGPHLGEIDGWRGIWTHEFGREAPQFRRNVTRLCGSDDDREVIGRGVAAEPSGALPAELMERLATSLALKNRRRDLISYGAVPTTSDEA